MEKLLQYPVHAFCLFIAIIILIIFRIFTYLKLEKLFEGKTSEDDSSIKKKLIKLYTIFAEWGDAVRFNFYIILGLIATFYLLCFTDTGIDVTEYMIEKRGSKTFMNNLFYTFLLYFFTFVWAIVNWITPQYDMTLNELKEIQQATRKISHRVLGLSPFFIIALSLGIDREPNTTQDIHWHLWYLSLVFLCILIFIFLLNYEYKVVNELIKSDKLEERIKNEITNKEEPKLKKWTFISIGICFLSWLVVSFIISRVQERQQVSQLLGITFLLLGFLFWFTAIWFDSKLSKNIIYDPDVKNSLLWSILFALTNWPGREKQNLNQREIWYCFSYRLVVLMGFLSAVFFTFAPNIQPVHPYIILTAGISFFIIIIDVLYFAVFKKHFYLPFISLYFKKINATGNLARFWVTLISFSIIICTLLVNGEYKIDNKELIKDDNDIRLGLRDVFKSWLSAREDIINRLDSSDTYPIFIIAGQGGGSRAAYWISQTLMKLDSATNRHLLNHCFSISTISGSSPGTAAMLAFWEKTSHDTVVLPDSARFQYPRNVFDKNFVSSGLAGNFFGDFIRKQIPFYWFDKLIKDRNKRLREEEAWCVHRALYQPDCDESGLNFKNDISQEKKNQNAQWHLHQPFLNLYYDSNTKQPLNTLPYLFSNTCNIQTGRRGVISPVILDTDIFGKAIDVMNPNNTAHVFNDTTIVPSKKIVPMTLSQATNLAELFPFFSAASTVDTFQYAYVDGGVYENYGLTTAHEIYNACKDIIEKDSTVRHMKPKFKLYVIAVINSEYSEKIEPINQFSAPFLASFNNHFGGYAERKRFEVKSVLTPDIYKEITLTDAIPLTRILTEKNMIRMDNVLVKELKSHSALWESVRKIYKDN